MDCGGDSLRMERPRNIGAASEHDHIKSTPRLTAWKCPWMPWLPDRR